MYTVLKEKPAPHWGFYGYLIRGIGISLFYYIPLALFGLKPSPPSYFTFLSTDNYYKMLVILYPIVSLTIWLLGGALPHTILRFIEQPSDIDQILNISGMTWLVFGPIIVGFDWFVRLILGDLNAYVWGLSHLIIDVGYLYLMILGYKKILEIPPRLTFCLFLMNMATSVPIAMLLLRG